MLTFANRIPCYKASQYCLTDQIICFSPDEMRKWAEKKNMASGQNALSSSWKQPCKNCHCKKMYRVDCVSE